MAQEQNSGERLSRFLAHAGIASRRHSEELIAAGRVQVNGVTVTTQGTRINPDTDIVLVDNKPVRTTSKHVYLLLHKPIGYVSTAHDPQGRPTVLDLLPAELRALRLYPVGRLDIDSGGLLLLTNDGDFALHLTHPRYSMQKHYQALVQGCPSESALVELRSGVTITEDKGRSHKTAPAQVSLLRKAGSDCWLSLTIHECRKRQVRRMLAAVCHLVLELSRIGLGSLEIGNLPVGKWRYLTSKELKSLQEYTHTSQTV
jgi:23S rRNA pseudouridine2605 synthase